MLLHEIDPFGSHHRDALDGIHRTLHARLATTPKDKQVYIDRDTLEAWCKQLEKSASAFERFRVCMKDEVEQKEKLAQHPAIMEYRVQRARERAAQNK